MMLPSRGIPGLCDAPTSRHAKLAPTMDLLTIQLLMRLRELDFGEVRQ